MTTSDGSNFPQFKSITNLLSGLRPGLSSKKTSAEQQEDVVPSNTFFSQTGPYFFVKSKMSEVNHNVLPGGNYAIKASMEHGFFLEKIEDFKPPKKIYGKTPQQAQRILNSFKAKENNLGVLLAGEKGSGKTMMGRTISRLAAAEGIPTLFITEPLGGDKFFQFLQKIQQQCIIFIDEFEKVYNQDEQKGMLTLLDGVFQSKKLFILTCNDAWRLDTHMRNRPGRIHYFIEYHGLDAEFIREYCLDNLEDEQRIEEVSKVCSLFSNMNFDMLQAIVWEMNLYKESVLDAIKLLNTRPDSEHSYRYTLAVTLAANGRTYSSANKTARFNPEHIEFKSTSTKQISLYFEVNRNEFTASQWSELNRVFPNKSESFVEVGTVQIKEAEEFDTPSDLFVDRKEESYVGDIEDEKKSRVVSMTFSISDMCGVDSVTGSFTFKDKSGNILVCTRRTPNRNTIGDLYSQIA